MKVLDGEVDTSDSKFLDNKLQMEESINNLETNIRKVLACGGEDAVAKHLKRGKLLTRDRITQVCDPGSPFVEFSQMAAWDVYGDEQVPSAGIITGIGMIHGK